MPPRTSVPATTTTATTHGKPLPKGPRDPHRPKKEEPKAEEPAGPTIRSQITNVKKASSGKSFLDAIRGSRAPKRAEEPAPPAPALAPAAEAAPVVEASAAPEPVAAPETAPPAEEPVPAPEPEAEAVQAEPEEEEEEEEEELPHVPVTLPESDVHFSWANDESYSFVNQYASAPQSDEPVEPVYHVQYPQSVIEMHQESNGRFQFKAPVDHMTIDSLRSALEKERLQLEKDRQTFEDVRQSKEIEIRNRQAQIDSMEREVTEQYRALGQDRAKFKQEQEHAKAQAQAQARFQQQQQQQSSPPPPVNAPHPLHQQQQQQAPGYLSSQDAVSWGGPPQQERWGEPTDTMASAPPYEPTPNYYPNFSAPFPEQRGKGSYGAYSGMMGRGGGSQQPHMGRGSMRGGAGFQRHAHSRRPFAMPRGTGQDNGGNHVFQQPPHGGLHLSPPVQSGLWRAPA